MGCRQRGKCGFVILCLRFGVCAFAFGGFPIANVIRNDMQHKEVGCEAARIGFLVEVPSHAPIFHCEQHSHA
eukprot:5334671-Amphidinium_carterae.1